MDTEYLLQYRHFHITLNRIHRGVQYGLKPWIRKLINVRLNEKKSMYFIHPHIISYSPFCLVKFCEKLYGKLDVDVNDGIQSISSDHTRLMKSIWSHGFYSYCFWKTHWFFSEPIII